MNPGLTIIVAPMHRLAQEWARRKGWAEGTYKTVTQVQPLRGLSPAFPIILLDTSVRFTDSSVLQLLRQRFTNVRTESA